MSDYSRHVESGQRARRRMQFLGETPKGHPLWTESEDAICKQYGSNYSALMKKLPHRTYQALRSRCQKLGVRPRRQLMTAAELSKLRRLGPTAPVNKLLEEFPTRTLPQIHALRKHYKIPRPKPPLLATGHPVLDVIRQRCAELRYSMVDLDELAGTKCYFRKGDWHRSGINYLAVCKAIIALDGEISVRWRDE